jgi:hypothetical protein
MDPLQAVSLINAFNSNPKKLSESTDKTIAPQLVQEKQLTFPKELSCYLEQVCPDQEIAFTAVGHPLLLLSRKQLSWKMAGFQIDAVTKLPLNDWHASWFVIATDGSEPVFINIDDEGDLSPVYSAMKTEAGWDMALIADSIGQFLLCAAAIDHALNFPDIDEPLDEEFNLNTKAAKWFFPLIKQYANNHYDEWAAVFENYLDDFS